MRGRRPRLAVLGGTFDRFHLGHEALLRAAFRSANSVAIGLTSARFLRAYPKPFSDRIEPYAVRLATVRRWLRREYPRRSWRIVPLHDVFGGSLDPRVDVLVVSEESRARGHAVNRERRRMKLPGLHIVTVRVLRAEDGLPVSSRRIRAGEIDRTGRRRTPVRIAIRLEGGRLARADVESAFRRGFDRVPTEIRFPRGRPLLATAGAIGRPQRASRFARDLVTGRTELGVALSAREGPLPRGWWAIEGSAGVHSVARFVPMRKRDLGLGRLVRSLRRQPGPTPE